MPYDLSACGLVTVCQLRAGGTGNTIAIGNDGGGVYIETEGNIGSRNIRIQNGNSSFSEYSSLNVRGNDQNVSFNTNSTERMRIASGGNVGIGTTSPNSKLHILTSGTSNYNAGANRGMLLTSDAGARVILENPAASVCNNHRVWTMKNDFGRLSFGLLTDSGAAWVNENILTMVCEGNVGIGTTSPAFKLHVEGTSFFGDTTNFIQGKISWNSTRFVITSCGTANIAFATDDFTDRMTIRCGTGNVGIGTSSPSYRLQVSGDEGQIHARVNADGVGSNLHIRPNAGRCGWVSYTEDAVGDRWGIGIKNGDSKLYFASGNVGSAGGTTRMVIDGGGCIGINTTTPSYRLHVNGTFYAAGSSVDYKQGICQYDTDSCMFMKLKPVTYQYKEEYKHLGKELKSGTQIGLIAEEVAETYPELAILVKENDNDVVRNVDYEKLSIILLSEVQKLRKEVDDLKTK